MDLIGCVTHFVTYLVLPEQMALHQNIQQFYDIDLPKTLFPLESTSLLLQYGAVHFDKLIYQDILGQEDQPNFQRQTRVYADKTGRHMRRTIKLDPVAEVFLYDIVYRNRAKLPRDQIQGRTTYGHTFKDGKVVPTGAAYRDFRAAAIEAANNFSFSLVCDISSYFNSIYHHDIEHVYRDYWSSTDADHLGLFLRQANGGRSVDCLAQGIMPAKILGHHFLRFLDYSIEIKSERMLRFMDDIVLFSNNFDTVQNDFRVIQQLLGEKALNINPRKTQLDHCIVVHHGVHVDDMRRVLLALRREIVGDYDNTVDDDYESYLSEDVLTDEQVEYLDGLLSAADIEEHDAELVLDLMGAYPGSVVERLPSILRAFPNLSVSVHRFCSNVNDPHMLAEIIEEFVHIGQPSEFQLFWLAKIARDYLSATTQYGEILNRLYSHNSATVVSKAAVLEIPESRWSFGDLRRNHLQGPSDWSAWAAAVGCRNENPAGRNHVLGYFANSSPINFIVAQCVKAM